MGAQSCTWRAGQAQSMTSLSVGNNYNGTKLGKAASECIIMTKVLNYK